MSRLKLERGPGGLPLGDCVNDSAAKAQQAAASFMALSPVPRQSKLGVLPPAGLTGGGSWVEG